jgi:predicted CXXCH cytochrome family protein
MRVSKSTLAVLLALLGLLAASATWILAAPRGGFHPAVMPCEGCHLAGKAVKPEQAHMLVASQEKLCGSCHQTANQVSHPSGLTPRSKTHADYPLDWKGDLTCSTCHEVHGKNQGLMRGERRGRTLCLSCHDDKFFVRMRDHGASMMETGHLDARSSAPGEKLDAYSRQCMECHGEKGDDSAPTVVRNMVIRHGVASLNHPIGANYANAVKFGGYRPESKISKKIMLVGGLVSCVSCHEGYSKTHGKLVVPGGSSALCFECHDL